MNSEIISTVLPKLPFHCLATLLHSASTNLLSHSIKQAVCIYATLFCAWSATNLNAATETGVSTNEFNSIMMWNTFELRTPDDKSLGTGFLLTKAHPSTGRRYKILVTADHNFSSNNFATVRVMGRTYDLNRNWQLSPISLTIRDKGMPLWKKSSRADVAAILCPIPDPPVNLGIEMLADDSDLLAEEIHPGDSVFVLGYPLGLFGSHGFPILRPGVISSYPLTPSADYPVIQVAFTVFPGNSGGPVYMIDANRIKSGRIQLGHGLRFVLGIVIQSTDFSQTQEVARRGLLEEVKETRTTKVQLDIARVVQASVIKELVSDFQLP